MPAPVSATAMFPPAPHASALTSAATTGPAAASGAPRLFASAIRRGTAPCLLGLLGVLAACGGGDGSPTDGGNGDPTPTPAISLALSASSVPVTAGSSAEVGVTVTRSGGFAGAVTVTATAPAGVTAAPLSVAAGSTTGTLVLQVAETVGAGSVSVTVRGNGPGVQEKSAALSLVVSAAPVTDFQLSLGSTSVEIPRGGTASVPVQVARTNFTGAVTLSASGLPAGVTATFDPAAPTGTSATMNLAATAGATLGTATVQVRGNATGVGERSASLQLDVASGGGGGSGNVTWSFCDGAVSPVWFAVRDGTGPWTRVEANASGNYQFQVDAARAALAWVEVESGITETQVNLFSREELLLISSDPCRGAQGGKTVNGTVTGLTPLQTAFVSLGSSTTAAASTGAASAPFTLERVVDGPQDLVASLAVFDLGATAFLPSRGIIRRGLNPPDNGTLAPLDFATEGFDLNSATLTLGGGGGDMVTTVGLFLTDRGGLGSYFAGLSSSTAPTYWGMPTDRLESGDFHYLQVTASTAGGGGEIPPATRQLGLAFREVVDRSASLGPAHVAPAVTSVGSGAVARIRATWTLQPEYNRSATLFLNQSGSQQGARSVVILASEGYLAGSAAAELEVPDFSGVTGWNATWGLAPGASTIWSVSSSGWTGPGVVNFPELVEGAVFRSGTRSGAITP